MRAGTEQTRTLAGQVLETASAMAAAGLNRGTAGNVSARMPQDQQEAGQFLITPTGMDYAGLQPADIVPMNFQGEWQGRRKPSSEWRFHRDIYQARPEIGAVIHAHSPFATALACMELDIPPFHYMIARFGGADVRCAPYALFGTQALSAAALVALDNRRACLLAHHGMIVCGTDLSQTLALAIEFETLCEQYWRVLQLGTPKLIPAHEMAEVLEKFTGYGQQQDQSQSQGQGQGQGQG
ncbi:MAG: class II aldolase/adducin family protein [Sterolibacterium sp.]|nr:class II aldolase/adducin family protein [Sterolibacterium sp.]